MAAPHIPNLLTSRNARGSGVGRGRGRGSHASSSETTAEERQQAKDRIIQATDGDASVSRLSAVEVGYLDDPFAKFFVAGNSAQRRFPIINRGLISTSHCNRLIAHALTVLTRNLCANHRHRPSHLPLPVLLSLANQANHLPRCRVRYTLFPTQEPVAAAGSAIP